jgi:succinate dehydrogenase/fumarate reductase flavoprotein subunit
MYAAIAAARNGSSVLLLDKGLVGRGGATIMAQMTVAAAISHQEPDHWTLHLADTMEAGRDICNGELSKILCEEAPERIFEMERWGTQWAREGGHIKQVVAPGHNRPRCCYVDFLNTGPAVAGTLRRQVSTIGTIKRLSNVAVTEVLVDDGRAVGAAGLDVIEGEVVTFEAKAVILAAGGLTKLYSRNSASTNMAGEAYALALWAGADLVDMEFVQFFPIAHLAPRLVGMDPIMWDPFRYKLGGRLLNGNFEEFMHLYGGSDAGKYTAVRDQASYAISKEVEAGRGSPHGGVYLDFRHLPEAELRSAFGPVIDRLLANSIDLTKTPIEVGPTAHYQMGGVRVNSRMETSVQGLYAAGEAVGGANGANRLSGNAISEALVFGERAGRFAAEHARRTPRAWNARLADPVVEQVRSLRERKSGVPPVTLQSELKELMWENVGSFRTEDKLTKSLERIKEIWKRDFKDLAISRERQFNLDLQDWFELRAMLTTAEAVATAALARKESRGAHQRLDFPGSDASFAKNQLLRLEDRRLTVNWAPVVQSQLKAVEA